LRKISDEEARAGRLGDVEDEAKLLQLLQECQQISREVKTVVVLMPRFRVGCLVGHGAVEGGDIFNEEVLEDPV
jgi:hypothetical protein